MDHNDIRHKLSEYIDGEVSPDEASAIEEHLRTCTECSDALRELRKTIEHIQTVEEVQPPAWMTSKIMTKVREEQKAKKSIFQHLFYPLEVKLPIQAVAVLFLTVTAYYVYNSMQPAEKYAEAPMGRLAKEETRPEAPGVPERKGPELSAPQEKKAKQAPGYRSLDMKYSYEKPAAPVPAEQPEAAPAPAKEKARVASKDEADAGKRAAASKATAPSLLTEQAAPEAGRSVREATGSAASDPSFVPSYQERSSKEFISTIKKFPYRAPASRNEQLLRNYPTLMVGASKDQVAALLGDPDFSITLQAKEPPFTHVGTEWRYYLYLSRPSTVNERPDKSISIFFDPSGFAYSIVPVNVEGLVEKGYPRSR
jgi:anti-sigma factor RsiW